MLRFRPRTISLRMSLSLLLASAALLSFTVVATLILLLRLPQVEQRGRRRREVGASLHGVRGGDGARERGDRRSRHGGRHRVTPSFQMAISR